MILIESPDEYEMMFNQKGISTVYTKNMILRNSSSIYEKYTSKNW